MLKLEVRKLPVVTVVRCSGRIVHGEGALALVKAVVSDDRSSILIDLSGVEAVDAAGLGAFAQLERWARGEKRTIYLVNPAKCVREALEITGLSAVLQILPAEETVSQAGLSNAGAARPQDSAVA